MSAGTIIAQAFGENANLYTTVLGIDVDEGETSTVTASQLRKAYYKRALLYHPDKQNTSTSSQEEIDLAKRRFQAISIAYNLLCDSEKRREYDETGELDDSDDGDGLSSSSGTKMWEKYFKSMFSTVTTKDIDEFTFNYKCSDEEKTDVLKYYATFKGDLNKCIECVMCSDNIDKRRWVEDYIIPAIQANEVDDYMDEVNRTLGGSCAKDDGDMNDSQDEDIFDNDMEDTNNSTTQSTKKDKRSMGVKEKKAKVKTATKKKTSAVKHKRTTKAADNTSAIDQSLIASIRGKSHNHRQAAFGSMIAGLEDRYASTTSRGSKRAGKKNKKKSASQYDDIPDDEFQRIQAEIESRRSKGRG